MATPKVSLTGSYATIGSAYPTTVLPLGLRDGSGNAQTVLGQTDQDGDHMNSGSGLALSTFAAGIGYNGSNWDRLRAGNGAIHTAENAALANAATLAVWTPASGKRFRVLAVAVYVGTAGHYQIADGTTVYDIYFGAGWNPLPLPRNGYLSVAANNALGIINQTGAAAVVAAIASGTEE